MFGVVVVQQPSHGDYSYISDVIEEDEWIMSAGWLEDNALIWISRQHGVYDFPLNLLTECRLSN